MTDKTAYEQEITDREVEKWKMKKLIKNLQQARGNGTSLITLMLTPKDQVALMVRKLTEEHGTAASIKSHVTKLAVQAAITSVLQRLKLYSKVPPNGLIVYSGSVVMDGNKEKKVTIDMSPIKPVPRTMYMCDNKFHVEALLEMLESDDKFGFIIMDGNGALFGTLAGNTREILHKFSVELPKKHGRGGQSALRFARLRLEKRISGLVLAGSADFKNDLNASDMFDQRLQPVVIKVVDVAYGGENGFNQAVELSADCLAGVRFIQEKKLISKYFDEISRDTNMYCFGVDDTLKALEMGALERLIVWEELDTLRLVCKNPNTGDEKVYYVAPTQMDDKKYSRDPVSGATLEVDTQLMVEWFAENYKKFGCSLEFVTNKSQEGFQFVKGFGGIGGLLRFQIDFMQLREMEEGVVDAGRGGGGGDDFDEDDFM